MPSNSNPLENTLVIQPPDTLLNEDKEDNISKYINPSMGCVCCNMPVLAIKINEAYLNGFSYKEISEKFSDQIYEKVGKKLSLEMISEHFSNHFNYKGAAIAEYNRKNGMGKLSDTERNEMTNVFSVLVNKKISDVEMIELLMHEQVKRLEELEVIKKRRIQEGKEDLIESIIMKQEQIVNNIQTNVLNKLKTLSKLFVNKKQVDIIDRQMQFLDHGTAEMMGIQVDTLTNNPVLAKEAEKLYKKIIIELLLKKIKSSVDIALNISQTQKTQFYKELQKNFSGIENEIEREFKEKVKSLKEVKK